MAALHVKCLCAAQTESSGFVAAHFSTSSMADAEVEAQAARDVSDIVWGTIKIPAWLWTVVKCPVVQRLRNLRQLGFTHMTFPGACHDRFSHSLGACSLALRVIDTLQRQQPELAITKKERNTVALAALLHDVGHGPFSHAFERFTAAVDAEWSHETQSQRMFAFMCRESAGLQTLLNENDVDCDLVPAMIAGRHCAEHRERKFLFDIVANTTCGVDVDKWDYLLRDSLYLRIPIAFDAARLLESVRVISDGTESLLAWSSADVQCINHMFISRFNLHAAAYQTSQVRVHERMVMEALILLQDMPWAVPVAIRARHSIPEDIRLRDVHKHDALFAEFTDIDVLNLMKCARWEEPRYTDATHSELELQSRGMQLLARVAAGDVWPLLGETTVLAGDGGGACVESDIKAAICAIAAAGTDARDRQDLERAAVIDVAVIHCGKGAQDPVSSVPFYAQGLKRAPSCGLRYMRLKDCQQRVVRLYYAGTTPDRHIMSLLSRAFETWVHGLYNTAV